MANKTQSVSRCEDLRRLSIGREAGSCFLRRRYGRMGPGIRLVREQLPSLHAALTFWTRRREGWALFERRPSAPYCMQNVVRFPGEAPEVIGGTRCGQRWGKPLPGREEERLLDLPSAWGRSCRLLTSCAGRSTANRLPQPAPSFPGRGCASSSGGKTAASRRGMSRSGWRPMRSALLSEHCAS